VSPRHRARQSKTHSCDSICSVVWPSWVTAIVTRVDARREEDARACRLSERRARAVASTRAAGVGWVVVRFARRRAAGAGRRGRTIKGCRVGRGEHGQVEPTHRRRPHRVPQAVERELGRRRVLDGDGHRVADRDRARRSGHVRHRRADRRMDRDRGDQSADGVRHRLLVHHPTPPAFDGPEDRNGRRNHDEIRLLAEVLDDAAWLVDDQGKAGGLAKGEPFLIFGDACASTTCCRRASSRSRAAVYTGRRSATRTRGSRMSPIITRCGSSYACAERGH